MHFKIVYRKQPLETVLQQLMDCLMGLDPLLDTSFLDPFEIVSAEQTPSQVKVSTRFNPMTRNESIEPPQKTEQPAMPQPLLFTQTMLRHQPVTQIQTQSSAVDVTISKTVEVHSTRSKQRPHKEDSQIAVLNAQIHQAEKNKSNATTRNDKNKYSSQVARLKMKIKEIHFQNNIQAFEHKKAYIKKHQDRLPLSRRIMTLKKQLSELDKEIDTLFQKGKRQTCRKEKNKIAAKLSRRRRQFTSLNRELVEEQYRALSSLEKASQSSRFRKDFRRDR